MILLVVLLVFGASIVRRRFPKLLARRPSAVLVTGGGGAGGRGLGGGGGKDKTTVASRGLVVGNMRDDPPLYDERNPDVVPYDKGNKGIFIINSKSKLLIPHRYHPIVEILTLDILDNYLIVELYK